VRRGYDKTHRAESPGGGYPRASVAPGGPKQRFNRDLDFEGVDPPNGAAGGRKSTIYTQVMGGGLAAADKSQDTQSRSPRKSLSPGPSSRGGFRPSLTTRAKD